MFGTSGQKFRKNIYQNFSLLIIYFLLMFVDFSYVNSLTVFRMSFFGAAQGWGEGKKAPPPLNLSHISYNDENWHNYTLPKEDPKNI